MPRPLIMTAAILTLASVLDATSQARAEVDYPYCLANGGYVQGRCEYTTLEQCKASASGLGGYCAENPFYTSGSTAGLNGARKRRR